MSAQRFAVVLALTFSQAVNAFEVNHDKIITDKYIQFVMNLAAGMPIDKTLFGGGDRRNNSRGGKGINASMFADFWMTCLKVLLPA